MKKTFAFLMIGALLCSLSVYAHPGGTASDGCHYCRTNCDAWGVPWDERHCHGYHYQTKGSNSDKKKIDGSITQVKLDVDSLKRPYFFQEQLPAQKKKQKSL